MKKILIVLMTAMVGTTGCTAQQAKDKESKISTQANTEHKPKENWHVNKRYDDKGNLIRYDSTYTWSYSSSGKLREIDADSVRNTFRQHFHSHFPSFFNSSFGDPIWNDSLFYKDFTSPDYFMQKWNAHYFDMGSMMLKMDSLHDSFLNKTILN